MIIDICKAPLNGGRSFKYMPSIRHTIEREAMERLTRIYEGRKINSSDGFGMNTSFLTDKDVYGQTHTK